MNTITITSDPGKLDVSYIYNFLSTSYWANERTREQIETSIANSKPYGLYLDGKQIGFARILSDRVVFAYLMDLFIDEAHQGKGYSKLMMEYITSDPELRDVKKWYLKTKDAHGLYEQFGFKPLDDPKRSMERNL